MSITFKFLIDKRRTNKKQTYPIRVRIYQDTDYKEYSPGITIPETAWAEDQMEILSDYPDASVYNAKIVQVKTKIQKLLLLADLNGATLQPQDIISSLNNVQNQTKQVQPRSIILYGREQALKLQERGKAGNSIVYTTAINKLLGFVKSEAFPFEDLNYSVLDNWNTAMLSEGLKVNAIANYMRTIRAIYNKAIKEKLVKPEHYPFDAFKIKTEKTRSRNLPLEEIQRLLAVPLERDTPVWHYRNAFLLSFCLIGINFADLVTLKRENVQNSRVTFTRKKTGKIYSIKLHPQALRILQSYMQQPVKQSGFIFPFVSRLDNALALKRAITQALRNTNENLKRIAKAAGVNAPVTTYYARYSWANIAKSLGYSKDQIAEALGHEYGNRVTGIYLDDYDLAVIGEMNRRVL